MVDGNDSGVNDGFRYFMVAIETDLPKERAAQFVIDAIRHWDIECRQPSNNVNRIAVLDLPQVMHLLSEKLIDEAIKQMDDVIEITPGYFASLKGPNGEEWLHTDEHGDSHGPR